MTTDSLDNEFMQYWLRLTTPEKQSLLSVARNYVHLKHEATLIDIEEYNKDVDEAIKRMDDGKFYSHEQVVEISKTWLKND